MVLKRIMLISSVVMGCGAVRATPTSSVDGAPANDATSDGFSAPFAASCVDIDAANADVVLYLDGDPTRPFNARCGPAHETYLVLGAPSTSTYPVGGCATLGSGQTQGVITQWTAVRFDPATRTVTTGDYAGASSTGETHEDSGNGTVELDYAQMPFGSGRSCTSTSAVVATIDLTHTVFAIAASQAWSIDGFNNHGVATVDTDRKTAQIAADGFSTGTSPCAQNTDYYTTHGGPCLVLDYAP